MGCSAAAEESVDVVEAETRVEERSARDLGVDLGDRVLGELPAGMFEDADDRCSAPLAQCSPP